MTAIGVRLKDVLKPPKEMKPRMISLSRSLPQYFFFT